VVALTRTAALEYAAEGLNITAVAPGAIRTRILNDAIDAGVCTEDSIAAMHPVKRLGKPIDIALAISFLSNSPFVTGSVLEVDGGVGAS
jgi:NAD(P)-dependent dehydrogenase (short-subunit alcohol dehydrogenase family)